MLDEASARVIAALAASGLPPLHELTPEQARAAGAELAARPVERPELARVRDIELDGPRVRVLVPRAPVRGAIVYYHGGGWVTGGIDAYDALARRLADRTGCAVVLAGYRLAPEHRYPTAVEDAWTALRWTADHVQEIAGAAAPIIVAGDSAGGCLAAVMAQRSRDDDGPEIALQVLVYPVTDSALDRECSLAPENQLLLTRETMAWFWDHSAPDPADRARPDAAPLRAGDLSGL